MGVLNDGISDRRKEHRFRGSAYDHQGLDVLEPWGAKKQIGCKSLGQEANEMLPQERCRRLPLFEGNMRGV